MERRRILTSRKVATEQGQRVSAPSWPTFRHSENLDKNMRVLVELLGVGALSPEVRRAVTDPTLDWPTIAHRAGRLGVSALLYSRLGDHDFRDLVPLHTRRVLKEETIAGQARNMKVYAELRKVLAACVQQGLPVLVLKGAALAELVYRHIGLRTMADVDLLVRKEDLQRVSELVEALGFVPNEWYRSKQWYVDRHHHLVPYVSPDGSMTIEIHWHVIERTALLDLPIEAFWARPHPAQIAAVPCHVPAPAYLLLHVALHLASPNRFQGQLRGLCDVAELLRRYDADIDWDELLQAIRLAGAERYLYLVFLMVAERLGAAVPVQVLATLKREARFSRLEERWLLSTAWHAALMTDVEAHPYYEWVALDLLSGLLGRRLRREAIRDVLSKVRERFGLAVRCWFTPRPARSR